jgi:DNA polymerase-3 subunit epsilon
MAIGCMSSGIYQGSAATGTGSRGFTPLEVNPDADPDGYLYGRVVVFTGTLMSMTRDIARQECARVGAIPEQNTTKKTNVLVVGDINPAVLRPDSNLTGKARKAFDLQDKGQAIEVMTEDDFLRCLDGKALTVVEDLLDEELAPSAAPKRDPLRSVPLDQRPVPKPPKPPRPLRRVRKPVDQACSVEDCGATAAFKTRSKPAYCDDHITGILRAGGLEALESFTHPNDYLLTRCLACGNVAHYRFAYVLEKNSWNEATCRACFWREWAEEARALAEPFARSETVPFEQAQAIASEHGFIYLGPLTSPSLPDDPHRTECGRCGRISAERLGDITFGCPCGSGK